MTVLVQSDAMPARMLLIYSVSNVRYTSAVIVDVVGAVNASRIEVVFPETIHK